MAATEKCADALSRRALDTVLGSGLLLCLCTNGFVDGTRRDPGRGVRLCNRGHDVSEPGLSGAVVSGAVLSGPVCAGGDRMHSRHWVRITDGVNVWHDVVGNVFAAQAAVRDPVSLRARRACVCNRIPRGGYGCLVYGLRICSGQRLVCHGTHERGVHAHASPVCAADERSAHGMDVYCLARVTPRLK